MGIAGIHGYIGQLIYSAALAIGVSRIYGFDPGPRPADFRPSDRLRMITCEEQFYELDADLFHIATHPDQRQAVYRLLDRGQCVNIEKPMAHPAYPEECNRLRKAALASAGSVLFDFVEAFNPCTLQVRAILSRLRQHEDFRITHIRCVRAKDREDRYNPRNRKVIVPIQYQETAHCLAMLLLVLDRTASFPEAFPDGLSIEALSAPYDPPNPADYPFGVVDGRVSGVIRAGELTVSLHTDFKRRSATPYKSFKIMGVAGRREFTIEVLYDGVGERLLFNNAVVLSSTSASRHQSILRHSWGWHCDPPSTLLPDSNFAWLVFGLSAALWASCHEGREIRIESEQDLRQAMRSYPDSLARRACYPPLSWHEEVDHGRIV
jgi:predicted dehydrogenase